MNVSAFDAGAPEGAESDYPGWLPVWLELDGRGRLRNYSTDPECVAWAHAFYHHPVGTARSFGYCGA